MISDRQDRFSAGLGTMDRVTLSRLLALAGPALAPELMRRLIADLVAVRGGLSQGLAADKLAVLRQNAHVLVAITGTIGATEVYEAALALLQSARADDLDTARARGLGLDLAVGQLAERLRLWAAELGMDI